MASRFQAAALVGSPSYPNAIAWSDENLIAVASGHLVTILNPALPFGPRGLITVPSCDPFPIGVVERQDLLSSCLLPTSLFRDCRPCVRSISWSPLGMAPNSGCMLAVCTMEGRVKLYRPPYSDFCAEWIEVMDISDKLYDYLASINFGEPDIHSLQITVEQAMEHGCADDLLNSNTRKNNKRKRVDVAGIRRCSNRGSKTGGEDQLPRTRNSESDNTGCSPYTDMEGQGLPKAFKAKENALLQIDCVPKSKAKEDNKIPEKCTLPLISADQYASRSAMLSSLAIAWSPVLQLPSKICPPPPNGSSNRCSLLAVGGKSGKISVWRIHGPRCYSVEPSSIPTAAVLIGLHQAHNSWITTISWALLASDSSNPQVLLATGSSDGSVRIWLAYGDDLLKSSEVIPTPFILSQEVIAVDTVPISAFSLIASVQSLGKMFLAIGKGSGSLEVWICEISGAKFAKTGSYNAHDRIVTGLAWAFDECCLYSCSQDNFMRSWILRGSSLHEVPIPSNTPRLRSSTDIPDVFDSCLGVALSPGNLVVAVVRSFDVELLNPMYQARAQKAAVEFFWIGGQELGIVSESFSEFGIGDFPGFSEKELVYWVSNILWSLKQYEHGDRPLVVWDIIAALSAFEQSAPKFVERILFKWLSDSFMGSHVGLSSEKLLSHVARSFSKKPSRLLHLLNIICRRVVLAELKADQINSELQNLERLENTVEEHLILWMQLLRSSEKELRERLVGFSFSAFLNLMSHSAPTFSRPGFWYPVGLAQMEQWVGRNRGYIRNQLNVLASEVSPHRKRLHRSENVVEERCNYCSASVPFESPEVGFCRGSECTDNVDQSHQLARCAVSMQVCPATPLWFCVCCRRWASNLAPEALFTMSGYPLDFKSVPESSALELFSRPLCPFCGILLQRLQPEFLLSTSPV